VSSGQRVGNLDQLLGPRVSRAFIGLDPRQDVPVDDPDQRRLDVVIGQGADHDLR
jgi:hypothetical protein